MIKVLLTIFIVLLLLPHCVDAQCCQGIRGNVDNDPEDKINITDLTWLVGYLFTQGADPACFREADINANGAINIVDLTYLVGFLFTGGDWPKTCPSDTVLFPMPTGREWVYLKKEDGTEYLDTLTILRDSTINDQVWSVTNDFYGITILMRTDTCGMWYLHELLFEPALVSVYPAPVGYTWHFTLSSMPPSSVFKVIVEAVDETVTTPAGTFSCYRYFEKEEDQDEEYTIRYIAPGVGIIKEQYYDKMGGSEYVLEEEHELVEVL